VWGPKRSLLGAALIVTLGTLMWVPQARAQSRHQRTPGIAPSGEAGRLARHPKLDRQLAQRAETDNPNAIASVIVTLQPGAQLPAEFAVYARTGRLDVINGHVVDVPVKLLRKLEAHPDVFDIHDNRPVALHNFRTGLTVGSRAVERAWGLTGAGIGVAVIDSGIAYYHDDFTVSNGISTVRNSNLRVAAFVDFVNGQLLSYDDNGHGTHVSGIIAGNGYDSDGQKAGVAPDATLISLKVLNAQGQGTIGHIIAALDWVLANHAAYNIRVVNLSVGAGIYESYWTDPLTLAAKRLVDAGIVIVAAAGNLGQTGQGQTQYGGITAPGNAPWVLTVGASSTMGTPSRADDTMASYSSRGPTYLDWAAKPDLVAPGTGTVSPIDREGALYKAMPQLLIPGTHDRGYLPYMSLSGTSMAAPVVAGTVALMVQANPGITPNGVKAVLQYTSQSYAGYDSLTQGAGFLNTLGAVRLARFFATAQPGDPLPIQQMWSKHIIWGNYLLTGGVPLPGANAWGRGVVWGAARTATGSNIVWGAGCPGLNCNSLGWGSNATDNIVWGSDAIDNIVWGSGLGADEIVWGSSAIDNIVWGSDAIDNIVWGSDSTDFNIVWGSDCGGSSCDNIVWGGVDPRDGSLWGTAEPDMNIVWGSDGTDNIVWGSSDDANITWGSQLQNPYVLWSGLSTTSSTWNGIAEPSLASMPDDQLLVYVIQIEAPTVGSTTTTTTSTTTTSTGTQPR
jgi:serine protease AprX